MIRLFSTVILFVILTLGALAQEELSVERIMQDPNLSVGSLPEAVNWNMDGAGITFRWNPENDTLPNVYGYSIKKETITKLSLKERDEIVNRIIFSNDRKLGFFVKNGAIFKYNFQKDKKEKLIHLDQRITDLKLISYQNLSLRLGETIYLLNWETKLLTPIIRFGDAKSESSKDKQDVVLEDQQVELFDAIRDRIDTREARSEETAQIKPKIPVEVEKPKGNIDDCVINPKVQYAALVMHQPAKGTSKTKVPHYVTESGYVEVRSAREKVGDFQGKQSLHVIHLETSEMVSINTSDLDGIKDLPAYYSDYPNRLIDDDDEKKDRSVNVTGVTWSPNGKYLVANILSDDNKDRWIVKVDPENGALTLLDRQHDDAWIGGPGIGGWSFWSGTWGWLSDGETLWFQSEKTGYSHLYSINVSSLKKTQITKGAFEIYQPYFSTGSNCFYFTANKGDWGQRHFYRINPDGNQMVQLTSMEGNNEVEMSYDEKYLAIRNSYANKPWELFIQKNKPGAEPIQITDSPSNNFKAYVWRVPEFVTFKASDGEMVPARLYKPENPEKNGPAVIFVHGAGYLQNAHKWWSSYFREYMFHNLLVDKGYTVLDIDYRGSAGYGRNWRTAIYRHMGGKDLTDQVDGANYLVKKHQVAKDKIGIYGGSYGGFITLMAMFNYPDVFKAGAALRSVTDWAHYNHGYTENILNTPALDSLAYRQSSPIYFAEGLKGALLMCHGLVDDNVQFQDIVRLSQRLIELGKENWELAVYPVEPHGFVEPASWTDEYKRILKLFEDNLK